MLRVIGSMGEPLWIWGWNNILVWNTEIVKIGFVLILCG